MNRRELLQSMALTGVATTLGFPRWAVASDGAGPNGQHLVSIFLRGAADGLTVCAPIGESRYFDARPTLAISEADALPLDGFFALHPAAAGLKTLFDERDLAMVHASGLITAQRSHFAAQAVMEQGVDSADVPVENGWLGRYLTGLMPNDPLAAVALDKALPQSMAGFGAGLALGEIDRFGVRFDERAKQALSKAYVSDPLLAPTASAALIAADAIVPITELPAGENYPPGPLGLGLADTARLIHGESGLVVAAVNSGGWDHHDSQNEQIGPLLAQLGDALIAFRADLGDQWQRTTVIIQTEFGRRVHENASGGTDHGHGGVILAAGGGVNGGKVYGDWPGLAPDQLSAGQDLAVTTDYRQVLAEMLVRRMHVADVAGIFNGWSPGPWLDVFRPAAEAAGPSRSVHATASRLATRSHQAAPEFIPSSLEIPSIPRGLRPFSRIPGDWQHGH